MLLIVPGSLEKCLFLGIFMEKQLSVIVDWVPLLGYYWVWISHLDV